MCLHVYLKAPLNVKVRIYLKTPTLISPRWHNWRTHLPGAPQCEIYLKINLPFWKLDIPYPGQFEMRSTPDPLLSEGHHQNHQHTKTCITVCFFQYDFIDELK